jgi:hypothetical protein
MKPELSPGLGCQERGQPEAEIRVHQHGDAPFGDRADLGDGERELVGGEGDGLGVEVAARQDRAVPGDDNGIIGNGVCFAFEGACDLAQQVQAGTHHLWLAAQAVGVLDALVAEAVRFPDLGAGHQARAERRPHRSVPAGREAHGFRRETAPTTPFPHRC